MIGSTGNPNEASLEFSNNPNVDGEGETGKTPTDKVIVFTYQLDINKTFNGGTPICRSSSSTSSIAPRTITPLTVAR